MTSTEELIDAAFNKEAKKERLNWATTIVMVLFHIGAIAALFMFSWRALAVSIFLYWMTTGLGISLGYHRLHTVRTKFRSRWNIFLQSEGR